MAETFRHRIRQAVNRVLHPAGLRLVRRDRAFEMSDLLAHARRRGSRVATIIDVGASDGIWSLGAVRHFPDARFLLFEPLLERQAALEVLCRTRGFIHEAAAAGAADGTVDFAVDAALDGSGVAQAGAANVRTVAVRTIDEAVARHDLRAPFCLKLDTHGFEVPVLTGAARVLQETELLIVEAYNFQLDAACLRFHELCAFLEARGFRCCDLADPMRRPGDGVLWQMDLAFAPARSAFFSKTSYD